MFKDEKNSRLVLPRWNTFLTTSKLGELNPLVSKRKVFQNVEKELKSARLEWIEKKLDLFALEFLSISFLANKTSSEEVKKAAEQILFSETTSSGPATKLAKRVLKDDNQEELNFKDEYLIQEEEETPIARISALKRHLRYNQFDQVSWIDLGLFYSILGQLESAERAIKIALGLGYDNRFVLRSASRFYVHIKEFDQAIFWLRKSKLIDRDPWLIATEIAVSELAGKRSAKAKLGKGIINDSNFSHFDINELASSLGTLESKEGAVRKSRKLFRTALINPNENTLAQAQSIADSINLDLKASNFNLPAMYEAQARFLGDEMEYEKAFLASNKWLRYQPFSAEPAVYASYIAAVCMQDHEKAIEILKKVNRFSAKEFLVSNNLAFSFASLNMIFDAENALKGINEDDMRKEDIPIYFATKGLIEFRKGNIEAGRKLYSQSIKLLNASNQSGSLALAYLFWAREEQRINSDEIEGLHKKALKLAKASNLREIFKFNLEKNL